MGTRTELIGVDGSPLPRQHLRRRLARARRWARRVAVTGCFWLAVVLPFVALVLLYAGVPGGRRLPLVGLLVALNLLALYVGRAHRREDADA